MKKLILLLLLAPLCAAQIVNPRSSNASTSTIVADETTNADMNCVWVTSNSGNLPLKVSVTCKWNPSTDTLTVTNLRATTSIGTGTDPAGCGSATGVFCGALADVAGTPTVGEFHVRGDLSETNLKFSINGGAEGPLPVNSGGTGLTTFTRGFGATFDGGGSALTTGTAYLTIPNSCTIQAWNILVDAGTATFEVWRLATGTAIPTVANTINTSGVSISSGTAVRSTTLTDFTSTAMVAHDIIGVRLKTVATATFANFFVECGN